MKFINLKKLAVITTVGFIAGIQAACNYEVIVIGAGISGMAAAKELLTQGCNITVLEARNRTGGRMFTDTMGSNKVDMGPSWIHGIGPGRGDDPKYKGKYSPIY